MHCLRDYLRQLILWAMRPPTPIAPFFALEKEQVAMGIFSIKFTLPPPTASDVQTQRLVVEAANTQALSDFLIAHPEIAQGAFPVTVGVPASQIKSDKIYFELPDTITVTLSDIDKGGLEGGSSARTFNEVDDIAPPPTDASGITIEAGDKEQLP
jgi:hypothetical protein